MGAACTGMWRVDDDDDDVDDVSAVEAALAHIRSPVAATDSIHDDEEVDAAVAVVEDVDGEDEVELEVLGFRMRFARISFRLVCSCAIGAALFRVEANREKFETLFGGSESCVISKLLLLLVGGELGEFWFPVELVGLLSSPVAKANRLNFL